MGPQQQYMYLKQLEWAKWAAVDEVRNAQAATAAIARPLVTPVTPPADMDEEVMTMRTTPPPSNVVVPPVTPSRHVAAAAAKAKTIPPPGQPRKTPIAKRTAPRDSDDEEENEMDDVLPSLGVVPPARSRLKTSRAAVTRGVLPQNNDPHA